MNTEEKAKRYDEALEIAKTLYCADDVNCMDLETIFPELKEDENEKVRKELIKGFKESGWTHFSDELTIDDAIAWLEKQGEQKPRYSIGDVLCDKSCTTLNKDTQPNFEIIDIRDGMYICDKGSFPISQQDEYELVAKKIEQKPATIDIDKMVDDYTNNKERGNEIFGKPVPCMIRAYRQGLNDAIEKVLLKPAWSEEDESRMNNLCHFLEEYGNQYYGHLTLQGTISWLKSLRPQPKQEWSEQEQIRLNRIVGCLENLNVADNDILLKDVDWLKSLKQRIGG